MRIALHSTGEIGDRTGRILLAEPDLTALGHYGHQGHTEDRRTMAIRDLTGFSVLVTDEPASNDALGLAGIAADDGLCAVLAADVEVDDELASRFRAGGVTLLVGSGLAGIAASLAAHEAARVESETEVTIAWTVPGNPARSGEAIPFPDPVGARWGRVVRRIDESRPTTTLVEVAIEGDWAAAMAKVSAGRRRTRVVGVADLGVHLDAIALAAGTLAVAEGSYPPGVWRPADSGAAFLRAALRVGMDVAAFSS